MKRYIRIVLLIIVVCLSLFGLISLITSFNSNLFMVYTKLKMQESRLASSVKMYKESVTRVAKQVKLYQEKEKEYDLLIAEVEEQKELLSQSVQAVTDVRRNAGIHLPWACTDDFRQVEDEMLRKIDWFRSHPLEEGWYDTLRILSQWTMNVPYVNLPPRRLNTPGLGLRRGENPSYVSELNMMLYFGRIAYALQNDNDPVKATHNGILYLIELYKNLKKKGVAIEIASIEDYIHLAATGDLLGYIEHVPRGFSRRKKPK